MNHYNYKNSFAWPQAIDLITLVNHLSDDLPSSEQTAMGNELRRTVIDLATAVAVDLLAGNTARVVFAIRLETQLEVIRQVYPALDTAAVDKSLESLMDRLQSDKFAELRPLASSAVTVAISDPEDDSSQNNELPSDQPPALEPLAAPIAASPPPTTVSVQLDPPSA